jgi:hypothetical protein
MVVLRYTYYSGFHLESTCHIGVFVVHVAVMREAVVPVLKTFHQQGEEIAWGLMYNIPPTISATVAAATTDVATNIRIAAATTTAIIAITTNVDAATATAATVAAAIVATALLTTTASTPWASWLLLWGLSGLVI